MSVARRGWVEPSPSWRSFSCQKSEALILHSKATSQRATLPVRIGNGNVTSAEFCQVMYPYPHLQFRVIDKCYLLYYNPFPESNSSSIFSSVAPIL